MAKAEQRPGQEVPPRRKAVSAAATRKRMNRLTLPWLRSSMMGRRLSSDRRALARAEKASADSTSWKAGQRRANEGHPDLQVDPDETAAAEAGG